MNQSNALENAINSATENHTIHSELHTQEAIDKALKLVEKCTIGMLGTINEEGYPNIKAMIKVETEGLKIVWFSTNTSSKRISQLRNNPKSCVYFHDEKNFKGLMLVGEIEILTDQKSRERLWKEGCEIYYPLGVTDPDYSVLRFTTKWANYYEGLHNVSFPVL